MFGSLIQSGVVRGLRGRGQCLMLGSILAFAGVPTIAAAEELSRWTDAEAKNTCSAYLAFINDFPKGKLTALAENRANEKNCTPQTPPTPGGAATATASGAPSAEAPEPMVPPGPLPLPTTPAPALPSRPSDGDQRLWNWATIENSCTAYRRYLETYPSGVFVDKARRKVEDCRPAPPFVAVPATPVPTPVAASVPPTTPDSTDVLSVIDAYYRALNAADASTAASLRVRAPNSLASDVGDNEYFRVNSRAVIANDGSNAKVFVDATGKNRGGREERWRVDVFLVHSGTGWKIDKIRAH